MLAVVFGAGALVGNLGFESVAPLVIAQTSTLTLSEAAASGYRLQDVIVPADGSAPPADAIATAAPVRAAPPCRMAPRRARVSAPEETPAPWMSWTDPTHPSFVPLAADALPAELTPLLQEAAPALLDATRGDRL